MIGLAVRGLILSFLLTIGLELVHGLKSPWAGTVERLLGLEPAVFAIGVLLVWAVMIFLHALTNRFWVAATIVTVLAVIIGIADFLKLDFRGEPLFFTDATYLSEIGFLIENLGTGKAIGVFAALLAIPLFGWAIANHAGTRGRRRSEEAAVRAGVPARSEPDDPDDPDDLAAVPTRAHGSTVTRMVAGTAALTVIFTAATFNWNGSPARALYEAAGAQWRPWNQLQNYADNGVIAGLLYTLPASAMDEPKGYSQAAVEELVARYSHIAAQTNAERDENALADTNIIVILSESLSDPRALPGITVEEDPIPFLREFMAENPSGTMISSGFGGGTSNVEFEILTGMAVSNLQAQVDSPFQSVVADAENFPSHLNTLGAPERDAIAIHPYDSRFYRRSEVYPALGFERWAFRDTLAHLEKIPGDRHASDAALYDEVMDELRHSDQPMFINAVSMQNHSPYEGLADPIPVEGALSDHQRETAGQYLRGLKHSDDALRELVSDINALDERTIVLLYGDHLPSFWPSAVLDAGGETLRYETPWVVFANFPLEDVESGTYGANQLMNQLVHAAGAPITPWMALLDQVSSELPAYERTVWLDPSGQVVTAGSLSERARELLTDYRLAQYDMVAGQGWATDELLTPTEDPADSPQ